MAVQSVGPPVSIAVNTNRGWPHIERHVRSFEAAAARVGAEVVVADGSGRPPPGDHELAASTRWLSLPRQSVFQLRPHSIRACRAPIIALTEDHCLVTEDWAEAVLAAHVDHPGTPVIGGAVGNSATAEAIDWAAYFTVQARCLPPVRSEPRARLNHANVSYKRAALYELRSFNKLGMLDAMQQASTARRGDSGVARIDSRSIVFHDQHLTPTGFISENFHAGRTYGAFVRAAGGPRRWLRLMSTPAMPAARLVWVAVHARRSRYRAHLSKALPLVLMLIYFQAAGQVVGLLTGPGDSPMKVSG